MALEEYKRKRDFKKTSEPGPVVKKSGKKLSYLIQKHEATRLHYDFRLELDGVLLSWAVTKGPSLDPADKRLAVRTEDHPIAYGSFEGTIPQGEYGGGTVMLWDQGEWEPVGDPKADLKKGNLKFILKGKRLHGHWVLVRMHTPDKRENWLLIKEKDEYVVRGKKNEKFLEETSFSIVSKRKMEQIAEGDKVWKKGKSVTEKKTVVAKPKAAVKKKSADPKAAQNLKKLMAHYPDVQLATLVDRPPQGENWLHEIKYDGYRLLGFLSGGTASLRTRNGNVWTEKFPSLKDSLENLAAKDAVLDMEAVKLDKEGRSGFQALQAALSEKGDTDSIVAYVFDLLYCDGKDLTKLPLIERKKKLEALLKKSKPESLFYSDHVTGEGDEMIAKSCHLGLEGIISKQASASYLTGRQKGWLKSKCTKRQEFIITGWSRAKSGGRALGALYLGYYKDKKLHYAGKVGTGFTMKSAEELSDKMQKLKTKTPNFVRQEMTGVLPQEVKAVEWIKPEILCEVAFTEWTEDGHIRHPSFQGLREDKAAKKVTMEMPLPVEKVVLQKKATSTQKALSGKDLVLDGITITHPDRIVSETGHITKGMIAEYYSAVAPYILKSTTRHPLSLLRCPSGIKQECFFQRNPGKGLGPDVKPFPFKRKGKNYEYFYVENAKGLVELIQMGAIEIHPWGSSIDKIDTPNRMIFDLDPAPDVPFDAVKLAALDLRARLKKHGLESYLKCTGGKGLHVTVPLAEKNTWEEVKSFAEKLADQMVADTPEAYVATMTKSKRNGKIFIDFFRNDYTATAIADFAVRARDGAPVAMPLEWSELKKLKAGNEFSIEKALKALKNKKPDLKRYTHKQNLPKK